jgi:hypothetical protein
MTELFESNDSNTSRSSNDSPNVYRTTSKEVCQALPLQGADMETEEIYPTLNFNVNLEKMCFIFEIIFIFFILRPNGLKDVNSGMIKWKSVTVTEEKMFGPSYL